VRDAFDQRYRPPISRRGGDRVARGPADEFESSKSLRRGAQTPPASGRSGRVCSSPVSDPDCDLQKPMLKRKKKYKTADG